MRTLLVGGAGYIGAHTAVALLDAGHEVLVVDNLSNTSAEAVARIEQITGKRVPLFVEDARNTEAVTAFVREHAPVDAIIHLAGRKAVAESVAKPLLYWETNLGTAIAMLKVALAEGIPNFVFSSSATVYGDPKNLPISEDDWTGINLANPYGKTKRVIEEIIADTAAANPKLHAVSLRYFNPVGAHPSGLIGEDPSDIPNNLMPIVSRVAIGTLAHVNVFGTDYDTPDGTGLRDYIHVSDLARGHVMALEQAKPGYDIFNLGTGNPVSVLELIEAFGKASGRTIDRVAADRRPGDVTASWANPSKANEQLGWHAKLSIAEACRDYWNWQASNPNGYRPVVGD